MSELKLKIPNKLLPLYSTILRFIVIYGGRGSAKSWTIADFLIIQAYKQKKRILCTREIQKSIKDSVHKLLCDRIKALGLESFFVVTDRAIKGQNGSEFIFAGLRHNPDIIKSMEGIDYAWCEEAQSLSRKSLEILTPTIRKEGSQIIFSYNPTNIDDPVHVDYTLRERKDCLKIEINYNDNPYFPEVLRAEMEYDKEVDYEKYLHKWEGKCIVHAEEQVFYNKWEIVDFEEEEQEYLHGLDFGFSNDPTAAVRCFIKGNDLYIDREAFQFKLEITETANFITELIPTATNWPITADSARPESISHLRNINNMNIAGAIKGAGSVADGIEKIRGFGKIYIHPRCKNMIDEFRHYKWKKNKQTDEIMPIPEDKHNHGVDALRYALEKYGRQGRIIQTTGW